MRSICRPVQASSEVRSRASRPPSASRAGSSFTRDPTISVELLVGDQTVEHRAASLVERQRNAEPKLSPAKPGRRRLGGLRDHFERRADRRQILPALGRKRDGPRRATKKFYAEGGLQRLDMLADGAGGDAQLIGGALEAHVARGGFEGAQAIQGWKSIGHGRSLCAEGSALSAALCISYSKPSRRRIADLSVAVRGATVAAHDATAGD